MDAPARELDHVLRHGDRALILAQRLLEQIAHAPEIEQDMALANVALDLLGQARALYTRAGELERAGHDEDHFAYWRSADEFRNPLLVEQPAPDFAHVVVRQYLHDEYALLFWRTSEWDLAAKALKETTYHRRYSRGWMVRLGDGTEESHRLTQAALDALWPYTTELFSGAPAIEAGDLAEQWLGTVAATLAEATLSCPAVRPITGVHEHLPAILAELQCVARAHPEATW